MVQYICVGSDVSSLSQKHLQKAYDANIKKLPSNNVTYDLKNPVSSPVEVQLLDIGWVFSDCVAKRKGSEYGI